MKPSVRLFSLAIVSALSACMLSACGNKGPLFLPPPPTAQDVPGQPGTPATPAEEKKSAAPPIDPAPDQPAVAEPTPPVPEED